MDHSGHHMMKNSFFFNPIVEQMIFPFWSSTHPFMFLITIIICFLSTLFTQFLMWILNYDIKILNDKYY
jgi:hypothetical protein